MPEFHKMTDVNGETFVVLRYQSLDEVHRREAGWDLRFPNGEEVTGKYGTELARLIMNEYDLESATGLEWDEYGK